MVVPGNLHSPLLKIASWREHCTLFMRLVLRLRVSFLMYVDQSFSLPKYTFTMLRRHIAWGGTVRSLLFLFHHNSDFVEHHAEWAQENG
jgi:hypothetical protein